MRRLARESHVGPSDGSTSSGTRSALAATVLTVFGTRSGVGVKINDGYRDLTDFLW